MEEALEIMKQRYIDNENYLAENKDDNLVKIINAIGESEYFCTLKDGRQILEVFTDECDQTMDIIMSSYFTQYAIETKYVRCLAIISDPFTNYKEGNLEGKLNGS